MKNAGGEKTSAEGSAAEVPGISAPTPMAGADATEAPFAGPPPGTGPGGAPGDVAPSPAVGHSKLEEQDEPTSKKTVIALAILVVALLLIVILPDKFSRTTKVILRLNGSQMLWSRLMPEMAEAFLRQHNYQSVGRRGGAGKDVIEVHGVSPDDAAEKVIEIRGDGAPPAFQNLAEGKCDLVFSARPVNEQEMSRLAEAAHESQPIRPHIIGMDAIAVIVNPANSVNELSREQIAKIFTGEITEWVDLRSSQGDRINVYVLEEKTETCDAFKRAVLRQDMLVSTAVKKKTGAELAVAVNGDPNGIGFVCLPEKGGTKAVAIFDREGPGLGPSRSAIAENKYFLTQPLYLYKPSAYTALTDDFIKFALSEQGQGVVQRNEYVSVEPKSQGAAGPVPCQSPPKEYDQLVGGGGAKYLVSLRFAAGHSYLTEQTVHEIEDLANLFRAPKYADKRIRLLGFADNEQGRQDNLILSRERVEAVKAAFEQRKITSARLEAEGFGPACPRASNEEEWGREINRRVEIWLWPWP